MNQDLQNLEIKVENEGTTPQGRVSAAEWNILVAAVKSLDRTGGSVDITSILQAVADAGYATQEWVNNQDYATATDFNKFVKDFVTLDTTQAISGIKNFTNGLKVGGLSVYKSQDDTIYLDANLVVRGGITAFGTNETITPSIFEALPIDGITLKRTENGVLYVASGGSGGSGGGDGISIEDLESYLTTNGYLTGITGTMVTNALGYAPLSTSGGTITGDFFLKKPSNATIIFQPSNAAKSFWFGVNTSEEWFCTNGGYTETYKLIHSGNYRYYPVKNPTALSWSGFSSGSYDGSTAQSIAIPSNTNQLTNGAGFITASASITGNAATATSFVRHYITDANTVPSDTRTIYALNSGVTNLPTTSTIGSHLLHLGWDANAAHQMYFPEVEENVYLRRKRGGAWGNWRTILDSSNYSNYALPITGGTVKGQITSDAVENFVAKGTTYSLYFGIGTGQVNRGIYDLTQNEWWIVRGADATTTINASIIAEGLRINQSAFDNGLILNRTAANSGVGIVAMSNNVRLGSFGINGTKTFEIAGDNGIVAQVSTVTGEATFNGLTTIKHSGNTPLVINQTYATNNSRGAVLMNGSMANGHMHYSHLFGKAASSKNSAYVGFYHASAGSDSNYLSMGLYGVNNVLNITAAGNVGIGTTAPSEKLHVYGNILATGGVTARNSSDRRLKRNIRKFNASKVLMSLGGVYEYEYIDSEVAKNSIYAGSHYGLIYQNVKGTKLDVMCYEREDGFGTLNYIHPKFISLIAGATMENISEVEKLKRKIRRLENKVKQLENRA